MQELPQTVTSATVEATDNFNDPIIDREDVMWAARKFILLYGEKAAETARDEAERQDAAGRLRVAVMFERVTQECARLLKKSEKLRDISVH